MKIEPLFDRVLLRPVTEQTSSTGLHLPPSEGEKTILATVEAQGEGCSDIVKLGDKVWIHRFAGTSFDVDGVKHYLVKQIDILAKQHGPQRHCERSEAIQRN